MVQQTYQNVLHTTSSQYLIGFVFFSTVCSYNLHWYLTPHSVSASRRIAWAQSHKGWHLVLFLVGLLGAAIFFWMIRQHWLALAFAGGVTFLYTAPKLPQRVFRRLKKIAIGKTIFLAFVWTYVTTALPILVPATPWKIEYLWFILVRYFLIYSICILFDYRDREDDKHDGIRSMITLFDEKQINWLFFLTMTLFLVSTLMLNRFGYSPANVFILLLPGLLLLGLYSYAKKNFSDYLYYFGLDGLMALSSLLMLLGKI